MRADKLENKNDGLPIHREARLPGSFSPSEVRVSGHVEELISGPASEQIQWIFSGETEEEFEQRLSELEFLERAPKIRHSIDVLGTYRSGERTVYLDPDKIRLCADLLSTGSFTIWYKNLYRVVEIHEEAHAVHHLAADQKDGYCIWEEFDSIPTCLKEILAQLFTYEACKYTSRLLETFEILEKTQPMVYRLWRLFRYISPESLYWDIRDKTGRAERILERLRISCYRESVTRGARSTMRSRKAASSRKMVDAFRHQTPEMFGRPGRRYWAMRTDKNQRNFICNEVRGGSLRQGWGYLPEQDLDVIRDAIVHRRPRTDAQKETWRRNRRLHPGERDSVQIGDIILLVNLPSLDFTSFVEVLGGYRYHIHRGSGDHGHLREVQLLFPESLCLSTWTDFPNLSKGLKNRLPLWNIDHLVPEIERLLARRFTRPMTYEEQYPLLAGYGLHAVINTNDDPELWEAILASHWGPPEHCRFDISSLRFRVGPAEENSFGGVGCEEDYAFIRTPESLEVESAPERPGLQETANFIEVTSPSK